MTFINVAVAGLAAVSAVGSVKGAKAQRKAGKAQRAADRLQSWQNQMQQLRDFQVAVATSGTAWEGGGMSLESSGAQGTKSSAASQLASNIGLIGQGSQLSGRYSSAMNDANRWVGISTAAGSLATMINSVSSIVPRNPTTQVSAPNSVDTQNYGTQATPIGTTTRQPVYNTIDPYRGP